MSSTKETVTRLAVGAPPFDTRRIGRKGVSRHCEAELAAEASSASFLLYWTVIEPFSALRRVALLEGVRKEALRAGPCA